LANKGKFIVYRLYLLLLSFKNPRILLANLFLHLQNRDFRRSAPRLWAFRGVMGEATFRRFRVRQQYPLVFGTY
jgi:hypothetical protein